MKYLLYKDAKGEWRWKFVVQNGNTIAVASEGYKNKADCERSIEIVKGSSEAPVEEE